MSDPMDLRNFDMLKALRDINQRMGQTEVKEVPGGIPGFTSFYATGSFVPTWVGSGTAGTFTYTANQTLVEWSRIGNRVLFSGRIVITAITVAPAGNLQIAGWPFPGVADSNMAIAGGGAMFFWNMNIAAGYTQVELQLANGSSLAIVTRMGDNVGPSAVQGGELNVGDCRFEGQYRVA